MLEMSQWFTQCGYIRETNHMAVQHLIIKKYYIDIMLIVYVLHAILSPHIQHNGRGCHCECREEVNANAWEKYRTIALHHNFAVFSIFGLRKPLICNSSLFSAPNLSPSLFCFSTASRKEAQVRDYVIVTISASYHGKHIEYKKTIIILVLSLFFAFKLEYRVVQKFNKVVNNIIQCVG